MITKKKIAVGIDDFERIIERNCYFVDKTPFLKQLLQENEDAALLLTRPRRFGKSLTMSMLANFLAITNLDNPSDISKNQKLFEGLEIFKDTEFCQQYMGKYPVIFLSLKGVEAPNFYAAFSVLCQKLWEVYFKYKNVIVNSPVLDQDLKEQFLFIYKTLNEANNNKKEDFETQISKLKESLKFLSQVLYIHFNQYVVVIVDEYDVPVEKARHKFYDQMLDVIRNMLGNSLKSNTSVFKGIFNRLFKNY